MNYSSLGSRGVAWAVVSAALVGLSGCRLFEPLDGMSGGSDEPGTEGPQDIVFAPATIELGTVPKGADGDPVKVTVANQSNGELGPLTIVRSGADAGQFEVTGDTCTGIMLQPSSSCSLLVAFIPTTVGTHNAELQARIGKTSHGKASLTANTPDLFVESAGDDSNPGTSKEAAFRTVARALSVVKEGWTIHVGAGTFEDSAADGPQVQLPLFVTIEGSGAANTTIVQRGSWAFVDDDLSVDPPAWISEYVSHVKDIKLEHQGTLPSIDNSGSLFLDRVDVACGGDGGSTEGSCVSVKVGGPGTNTSLKINNSKITCSDRSSCVAVLGGRADLKETAVTATGGGNGIEVSSKGLLKSDALSTLACSSLRTEDGGPGGTCLSWSAQNQSDGSGADGPAGLPHVTCTPGGGENIIGIRLYGKNTEGEFEDVAVTGCDVGLSLESLMGYIGFTHLVLKNNTYEGLHVSSVRLIKVQQAVIQSNAPGAVGLNLTGGDMDAHGWVWNPGVQGANDEGKYETKKVPGPVPWEPGNNYAVASGAILML